MKILRVRLAVFGEGEGAAAPAAAAGSAAPQEGGAQSEAPARPTFDELIKGEYRQEFQERIHKILDQRLKNSHAELDAVRPIMALLQQRYGIRDGKGAAAAVRQALENDADYWAAAAKTEGMTPESYRRLIRAESKTRELEKLASEQSTQRGAREMHRNLYRQAQAVKAQYPDFDAERELQENPRFRALLLNHIDMMTAYQVCHQKEFLAAAQRQAESRTLESIRANRARPVENGTGGAQPVRLGSDPSKWTREQLREVERRVQRGEKIVL